MGNIVAYHCHHINAFQWCDNIFIAGKRSVSRSVYFFVQPLTTMFGITELLVKATPLVLIGVGLAIGFKANVWNIGAEGQFTMGAVFGGGTALLCQHTESILVLPLVLVLGTLGGLFWGAIPAFLKTRFNANEILTSLMLSYVAVLCLSYLVHGPWRDPAGFNFPESQIFSDYAMLPILIENSRLNLGTMFAILVVLVAWILMTRTIIGFQLRVVGFGSNSGSICRFQTVRTHMVIFSYKRRTCGTCWDS